MCGRFTIKAPTEKLRDAVRGLTITDWRGPRYNVAPTQPVPAVLAGPDRTVQWLRWGLVPSWAKDLAMGSRMINARAETLAEKPAFRAALRERRCVVLADGFYEWADLGIRKQPYLIQLPGARPFAIAALWESWRPPEGGALRTCTLITVAANAQMQPIHERMPVILEPGDVDRWLAEGELGEAQRAGLLRPWPHADLELLAVSTRVNRPDIDDPQCAMPVAI